MNKKFIVIFSAVFILGALISYAAVQKIDFKYQAEAEIRYVPEMDVIHPDRGIESAVKDIYHRDILGKVARYLGWIEAQSSSSDKESKIRELQSQVTTSVSEEGRKIKVRAGGNNPAEMTQMVNGIVREAEAFSIEKVKQQYADRIAAKERELGLIRQETEEIRQLIMGIKKQGIVAGMSAKLQEELERKESGLEKLLLTVKADHPDAKNLQQEVDSFRLQIKQVREKENQLTQYERNLTDLHRQADSLSDEITGLQAMRASVTGYFRIHHFSLVPQKPMSSDPKRVLLAGLAASAILGLLLARLFSRPKA